LFSLFLHPEDEGCTSLRSSTRRFITADTFCSKSNKFLICHYKRNNIFLLYGNYIGARGSVVGWGTMLQAGRSRVRFPMRSLGFFNRPNPFSLTMALESTQPLSEMSTRNLPWGKGRPERKADNLTAICEPTV
jgi:hypothetical protein